MARKKRIQPRTPKMADERYLGTEPEFSIPLIENDYRLAKAYNWYNYFYKIDDARPWLIDYMKRMNYSKADIKKVKETSVSNLSMTSCSLARISNRGFDLPEKHLNFLKSKIQFVLNLKDEEVKEVEEKPKAVVVAFDKNQRVLDTILADFEEQIDLFVTSGYTSDFSALTYYRNNAVKLTNLSAITDYYNPLLKELELFIKGDKSVTEGYDMTKKQGQSYLAFVKNIIDETNQFTNNQKLTKKMRAPRKKKVKTADQLTAKMNPMMAVHEFNIVGNKASVLIGAKTAYVYVPKTRNLIVYHAMDDGGFGVKGNKITGYNPETSIRKKLRKPDVVLKEVVSCGRVGLKKIMDGIRSTAYETNGRINQDTIIIRVVK